MSIKDMGGLACNGWLGTCQAAGCEADAVTTSMIARGYGRFEPEARCLEHADDQKSEAA